MNVKILGAIGALVLAGGCSGGGKASGSSGSTSSGTGSSSSGSSGGNCPPPSGTFSSNDAIAAAKCLALAWHPDAFVVAVNSGPQNFLDPDGKGADWTISFSSPSATCTQGGGQPGKTNYGVWVNSGHPQVTNSGTSCLGTPLALPAAPVDSKVVVPVAVPGIAALAPPGVTITWSAEIKPSYSGYTPDPQNQVWIVVGNWASSLAQEVFTGAGVGTGATCVIGSCAGGSSSSSGSSGTLSSSSPSSSGTSTSATATASSASSGTNGSTSGSVSSTNGSTSSASAASSSTTASTGALSGSSSNGSATASSGTSTGSSSSGVVTTPGPVEVATLAGNGTPGNVNGTGSAAELNNPYAVATDAFGNV